MDSSISINNYNEMLRAIVAEVMKCEFPDTDGFSPRSLWDMKRFYEFNAILPQPVAVSEGQTLPQCVAELPWGHNRLILSKN